MGSFMFILRSELKASSARSDTVPSQRSIKPSFGPVPKSQNLHATNLHSITFLLCVNAFLLDFPISVIYDICVMLTVRKKASESMVSRGPAGLSLSGLAWCYALNWMGAAAGFDSPQPYHKTLPRNGM